MIKTTIAIPILAACALLVGCSTPTKVDRGAIKGRTFNYINTGSKQAPAYASNHARAHELVQGAITENLARRGVNRVDQGGDLTVAYLIITGNNAATTAISDYFGYGEDAFTLLEKAHGKYTDSKNPNYFEAGTLLIDLVDSKTFKVLKRGYATRELLRNPSPEQQSARLREVVDEILRDVQFKQQ
jgi:hypothetical protein